jgi:hypothetical protein
LTSRISYSLMRTSMMSFLSATAFPLWRSAPGLAPDRGKLARFDTVVNAVAADGGGETGGWRNLALAAKAFSSADIAACRGSCAFWILHDL